MSADELEIVATWKHAVVGKFYVFRYLTKYTIFLSSGGSPNKAYGVLGLADPLEEVIGPYLPRLIDDGPAAVSRARSSTTAWSPGTTSPSAAASRGCSTRSTSRRRRRSGSSRRCRRGRGAGSRLPEKPKKSEASQHEGDRRLGWLAPHRRRKSRAILATLIEMTDSFCKEFLNEEYAELCRKLATALARKRPSPLLQGKLETWACGIVRTIGWVNYLDDRSQKPHLKLPFIDKAFGVAESTGQGKSKAIRTMFKIRKFDHQVDTAQPDGREPDGVDVGGQRLPDGHSPRPTRTSRSGL